MADRWLCAPERRRVHRDAAQVIDHEQLIFIGPGPDLASPIEVVDDENAKRCYSKTMDHCGRVISARRMFENQVFAQTHMALTHTTECGRNSAAQPTADALTACA
ncbi:hypothetical protein CR51_19925 [Caballeronia megalochromosomata]|nr:hypothetical protein CR51_19925 [Caballeronia megalochromosomata]